ncbi:MAG: response regulator [Myxococcota bacterium]
MDDSRAIRSIVSKQVQDLGFEVDEAENGEQGLVKLEDGGYDLVILDVTMPVMDGPEMLKKTRERGDKTAVLMLTSEAKRSVIADCMKAGIDDYIAKPFKGEELGAKIRKALKITGDVAPVTTGPAAAQHVAAVEAAPAAGGAKQFIDVLVIDDMDNVQKKLRSMLPAHLTVHGCVSAQSALNACRERVFRVILLDSDIPDVNSVALLSQLKLLQPHAAILSLTLRSATDATEEALECGYVDVLYKPFDKNAIEDFLLKYFDNQELLTTDDNILKVGAFTGSEDRLDRYFQRLGALIQDAMEKLAAACFDAAILDLSAICLRADHTPRLVINVEKQAKKVGLTLKLVGTPETANMMKSFTETAAIPFFPALAEAKAA